MLLEVIIYTHKSVHIFPIQFADKEARIGAVRAYGQAE